MSTAESAIAAIGWWMVLSSGHTVVAADVSSNPTTDRSRGTSSPRRCATETTAAAMPEIRVQFHRTDVKRKGTRRGDETLDPDTVRITSKAAHGDATVELLDHHFVKMGEVTLKTTNGPVDLKVPTQPRPIEALRVRLGTATQRYDIPLEGALDTGQLGSP